jgi:hypothetical protein
MWSLITKVAIFREKNYSAEHGTDGDFDVFRRNSICFAEPKTRGISFRPIRGIEKSSEFRSEPFMEEKTQESLFQTLYGTPTMRRQASNSRNTTNSRNAIFSKNATTTGKNTNRRWNATHAGMPTRAGMLRTACKNANKSRKANKS